MSRMLPSIPSIGVSIMPDAYATKRTGRTYVEQSSTSGEDVPSSDARANPSVSRRQAALDAARQDLIAAAKKIREDGARRSRLDAASATYRRAVDDNGAATGSKP